MSGWNKYFKKSIIIIIGSIISAYGIDLAIHAGFGGATLAVLWQGLAHVLPITIGQASFLVAIAMIVFCLFCDRSQIHIGTLLYQVFYSLFVDIFANQLWYSNSLYINFLIMIFGIIIFAFGTAMYSITDFGRGSYEALTFALVKKFNGQVKIIRMILDACVVILGILLGGSFGLCTVVTILISGILIQFWLEKLKKVIKV